jgi:hypothetical protein
MKQKRNYLTVPEKGRPISGENGALCMRVDDTL